MFKLIIIGVLSGAFFSSTFVLNEYMSISGGHWVWSASLRYLFMILFLSCIIVVSKGIPSYLGLFRLYQENIKFWTLAGGIGFGAFYALCCFAADYSPGWVIAATWQFTIVASLFVLILFGRSFPKRVWLFSLIIFLGVILINLSDMEHFDLKKVLFGAIPVMGAAFCYPFGNQLVWEAKTGKHPRIPKIDSPLLESTFSKVFLMTLGSLPLWIVLILIVQPPAPSKSQLFSTSLVALLSGVCATSLFLFARNLAKNSTELAGVDATQSSEVIFALIGGLLFLNTSAPTWISLIGLVLILTGLTLFIRSQAVS